LGWTTIQADVNLNRFRIEDETHQFFKNWLKKYTKLKNFLEENGRYPLNSSATGSEEKSLNGWIQKQKYLYNNPDNRNPKTSRHTISRNRISKLLELWNWSFATYSRVNGPSNTPRRSNINTSSN